MSEWPSPTNCIMISIFTDSNFTLSIYFSLIINMITGYLCEVCLFTPSFTFRSWFSVFYWTKAILNYSQQVNCINVFPPKSIKFLDIKIELHIDVFLRWSYIKIDWIAIDRPIVFLFSAFYLFCKLNNHFLCNYLTWKLINSHESINWTNSLIITSTRLQRTLFYIRITCMSCVSM